MTPRAKARQAASFRNSGTLLSIASIAGKFPPSAGPSAVALRHQLNAALLKGADDSVPHVRTDAAMSPLARDMYGATDLEPVDRARGHACGGCKLGNAELRQRARCGQTRNFKAVRAAGERYADAMGWRIIGKYDHQGAHKRTFFCES